jgi:magnesium transporter
MTQHPQDTAVLLESLPPSLSARLLMDIPPKNAKNVLEYMGSTLAAESFMALTQEAAASLLEQVELDFSSIILRRCSKSFRENMLKQVSSSKRAKLEALLEYPKGTAGYMMDPSALTFPEDISVREAIEQYKNTNLTSIYYLYVVDRNEHLKGILSLRKLLEAASEMLLSDLILPIIETVLDSEGQSEILEHTGWRKYHALPVTDKKGKFLGIIKHETFQKLLVESYGEKPLRQTRVASSLGELFLLGASGIFRAFNEVSKNSDE